MSNDKEISANETDASEQQPSTSRVKHSTEDSSMLSPAVSKVGLLIAVFFAGLVAFGLVVLFMTVLKEEPMKLGPMEEYEEMDMPWITAGIIKPQTEPADTDQIQPNQKVIGITLENKARAYLLAALDSVERTVVNDVIDGTPVSITYYPMESLDNEPEKRVRVFVDEHGSTALMMGLMGTGDGKMKIFCQEKEYFQLGSKVFVWHDTNEDGKEDPDEIFQLADLEFEVMNWGDWKKDHPETDVYLGRGTKGETPTNL
ncbi:MAG TPA: DUF3179 domain-containing protein [Planctomycetes bacterium]|nr:DUF3179 domain-containing protein [Planctomycetota bacterium]